MYSIRTGHAICSQCLLLMTVIIKHNHIYNFWTFNLAVYGFVSSHKHSAPFRFRNKSEWFGFQFISRNAQNHNKTSHLYSIVWFLPSKE